MNLRKPTRYGVVKGPLSDPGGRSVRNGLRRDKPFMRSGALATIGFFNLYVTIHYVRLALAQEYGTSFLDETTCLIVLPLAVLFLQDRRSWLPALSMLGYSAVLMLGAIIFPNRGVSQPISAILTIALDSKLAIMTFAFAWLFKRTGSAAQVFESLSILIIILCLINIPFIFHDLSVGVSITGDPLTVKGVFVQPHGLFMHQNEVAWLNSFGAFVAAARYRLRKRTLDLMLCALFVMLVCLMVAVKEMVGCLVGLLIIFLPNRSGFGSLGLGLAVLAGVAAFVLNFTELGTAVLNHVGMFYGSNAIDSVRAAMVDASFRIAAEHFPLGSGAGTFGSAGSVQFGYSQLYYDYGIYLLWGGSPEMVAFLEDTYWPKLIAEGGALGVTFYLLFLGSCGVYIFYRDPNATFADEVLRRLCVAFLLLILVISIASSPFTDELLTFVAALCLGYGMSRSLRAGGARNGVRSAVPPR
ncbi:MAG: O-antigen ligase family protein [Methylocella sp.]